MHFLQPTKGYILHGSDVLILCQQNILIEKSLCPSDIVKSANLRSHYQILVVFAETVIKSIHLSYPPINQQFSPRNFISVFTIRPVANKDA